MKIEVKFAELFNPLFLGGTNLQLKLDPTKRTGPKGLKMLYETDSGELFVTFNGDFAIMGRSAWHNISPAKQHWDMFGVTKEGQFESAAADLPPTLPGPRPIPNFEAQVSTPQSHVFAGLGGGTTGQEEKRGPGRPKSK